jgi:integrase/recombinase XerD
MVPLINNARATLEWFVRDVWCCFDDDHAKQAKLQQIQHSA